VILQNFRGFFIIFFGILPLEEVVFFFVTNILIVFGMTLMLSKISWERIEAWKSKIKGRS